LLLFVQSKSAGEAANDSVGEVEEETPVTEENRLRKSQSAAG
jgi:hypothetical protein